MKKIHTLLLMVTLLVSGKSFSQTDTKTENNPDIAIVAKQSDTLTALDTKPVIFSIKELDGNKVCFDTLTVRRIAEELVSYDTCKEEVKYIRSNFQLSEEKSKLKDVIISHLTDKNKNLTDINLKKDEQFTLQKEISNTYEKDLKKQKNVTLGYKILSAVGVIATTVLLLK